MIKKHIFVVILIISALFTTQLVNAGTFSIPGKMEAENFNGGEGVGFHDTSSQPQTEPSEDATLQIAYIEAGEWLTYTANVTAGFYYIEMRVAAAQTGGSFRIEFDNVDYTGSQNVPNTGGWTTFATLSLGPVELTAGTKILKVFMNSGPFNFNYLNVVATSESPTPSPSPTPVPTVSPNPPAIPALHVENEWIKDAAGNNVMLRGVAIADIDAIYKGDRSQLVPTTVFDIIDKGCEPGWNIDIFRLCIHAIVNDETGSHGWNNYTDKNWFFENIIDPAVMHVISKGKYAIVDWHYVGVSWDQADVIANTENFWLGDGGSWAGIAAKYANYPGVLFELFNEPGGGTWASWQTRAQGWINGIRAKNADNIIIVGGPNWSQVAPQNASQLLSGGNIVYANHIYPGHCSPNPPNWIDYVSTVAPVMMTEWGYEANGPAPVAGTTSGYGNAYKNWINSKPNVSWIAWCFDFIYHSYMFDCNWTLLGNGDTTADTRYFGGVDGGSHGMTSPTDNAENYMGQFTKTWLSEPKPAGGTPAPTLVPTPDPTAPPVVTPDPTTPPVDTPVTTAEVIVTPDPTAAPNDTPAPTDPPTETPVPGACTCTNGCAATTVITAPYAINGIADGCYETASLGDNINSWNMTIVNINGTDFTNKWAGSSSYPAPIGGKYYIYYKGTSTGSHFEIVGAGTTAPPTDTPAPTTPPAVTPDPTTPPAETSVPTTPPVDTPAPTDPPTVTPDPTAPPSTGCDNIVTGTSSGSLNTTGAYCFKTQYAIGGWGVSNFDGRTVSVTVNGSGTAVTAVGGTLPAKGAADYYHFSCSAGSFSWAAVYWW